MSFFSETYSAPEYYMVILMNSKLISNYVDFFVNNSVHCTTGDAKLIPIIIPTKDKLVIFEQIFNSVVEIKKTLLSEQVPLDESEKQLSVIEEKLDTMVNELYGI